MARAALSRSVSTRSAAEGSVTPDGCWCARINAEALRAKVRWTIELPKVDPFVTPILYALPVQLLAYHTAVAKGTDVDQPRNLAKSVTVE